MWIMNDFMFFPVDELPDLHSRLEDGKSIFTTRVSSEAGKYQVGQTHDSELGTLQVISLQHFARFDEHPFIADLTSAQAAEINRYLDERGMDVVELVKVA